MPLHFTATLIVVFVYLFFINYCFSTIMMDYHRLSSDELVYELQCMGLKDEGTDAGRRKALRNLRKVIKLGGSFAEPTYSYAFEEDQKALVKGIKDVTLLIGNFVEEPTPNLRRTIKSKLLHMASRAKRMVNVTDEQTTRKKGFIKKITELEKNMECDPKEDIAEDPISDENDDNSDNSEDNLSDEEVQATVNKKTSTPKQSKRKNYDAIERDHTFNTVVKAIPVYKWQIKFSGMDGGASLNSFLQQVEDYRISRNVTKDQLVRSACDLFTDDALLWYRAERQSIVNWDDMVEKLRNYFLPANYDQQLLEEINRRKQDPEERFSSYLLKMRSLMSRLTVPLPEKLQVEKIKKNLSPFYLMQMGLTQAKTYAELSQLAGSLDEKKTLIDNFAPPCTSKGDLEPELGFVSSRGGNVSGAAGQSERRVRCWTCGKPGHTKSECLNRKRCKNCGWFGVSTEECRKCHSRPGNVRRQQ